MDFKKLTRNPFVYVLLIGALLLAGMTLISSLTGAKQITTQEGLTLLKGGTVTEVTNTDGDQRVDMTLASEYQGATQVQFYYVGARSDEVVTAIDAFTITRNGQNFYSDTFDDGHPAPSLGAWGPKGPRG